MGVGAQAMILNSDAECAVVLVPLAMALVGSLLWDSTVALLILVVIAYCYGTSTFDYFKKKGIPYVKPLPFVGNFGGVITGRYTINDATKLLYDEVKKHRVGGVFQSRSPAIMVCDPELVKLVLTKDFASLHDHGTPMDEENDPLSVNLFNLPGARWKNMRAKLSPLFTSGKLKQFLPLMREVSIQLNAALRESAEKGQDVELKEILTRFSTDVIGTCAFGVECNSIKDPESIFYKQSQAFFQSNFLLLLRFSILSHSKIFAKLVPFKKLLPNMHEFFIHLMEGTIRYRKTNNVVRNDFVQMLMQLQENSEGRLGESNPDEVIFTDAVIAAQAFFFFVAGLDAIASSVGFALHHLCLDPRIQEDLADEIHSVARQHEGEITYQGLKEMKLLHMVVSETLRMYPPGGLIFREVTAPTYTFPETDFTVEKGSKVLIPIFGLHNDPDIFPEPSKFDPYRFTEEAISKRHPYAYLPFGEGPRVCIANRFALLEIRLSLAALIKDYKFSVCPKTQIPLKMKTHTLSLTPQKGFYFKIEKRTL